MDLTVNLGENVTGIGYQLLEDDGTTVGSRVTSGIDNPAVGVYVARGVSISTATNVYWDNTAGDVFASEVFETNPVLLSNGTGTGQLKLASGYVAITWADIAAPTTTHNFSGTTIGTATNLTNAPTAGDLTSTMVATIVSTLALNPVGSVLGDVGGHVIGNVYGNLLGSVAGNVAGSVGSVATTVDANVVTFNGYAISATEGRLRVLDGDGNAIAPAATALSTATWTGTIAGRIDAAISSRMATYTQPTGFLAANFSTGIPITGDAATAGTRFLTMIALDGSVYQFTANALDLAPGGAGGALSEEQALQLETIYDRTTAGVTVVSPVSQDGGTITAKQADTWEIALSGLGDLTDVDELWFSIKSEAGTEDSSARLFITMDDGLTRLNGSAYHTASKGSVAITGAATNGLVTVTVDEAVTTLLIASTSRRFALKSKTGNDVATLTSGVFVIQAADIYAQ